MDKIGSYEVKPFSKARQDIVVVSQEGKRRLNIHALLEVDVTDARKTIKARKGTVDISFTGWIVRCVSQAAFEYRQLNSYRLGRKKIVSFEDVDVPIPIEREVDGEQRPLAYIIRKANKKTVEEITKEIRLVQQQAVDGSTEVLGDLSSFEKWVIHTAMVKESRGAFVAKKRADEKEASWDCWCYSYRDERSFPWMGDWDGWSYCHPCRCWRYNEETRGSN